MNKFAERPWRGTMRNNKAVMLRVQQTQRGQKSNMYEAKIELVCIYPADGGPRKIGSTQSAA